MRRGIAREHEQAGGVAIEAMDHAWPFGILTPGDAPCEQAVDEGRLAQS